MAGIRTGAGVAVAGMALSSSIAFAMVAGFEGRSLVKYDDIGGTPTVCYGATANIEDKVYTAAECEQMLAGDLLLHTTIMLRYIKVPLSPTMQASLSSFTFNVGAHAFATSTLLKLLNAGDYLGACKQLLRWTRVHGKVIRGLVIRRKAEYQLCIQKPDKALA